MQKRLIVRAPQWLGDAVVCTSFVFRLRARNPDAHIAVMTVPAWEPLFKTHPAVDSFLPLPSALGGTVFDTARLLAKNKFDEIYVLPRSFRTALEAFLSRIPKRIGFGGDLRSLLLTETHAPDETLKYAHRYLKLLSEENIDLEIAKPYFPFGRDPQHENFKHPILGMAPSSVAPSRTWLPDRFAAVANQFISTTGGTVILFGSKKEQETARGIAEKIQGHVVDTTGTLDLPALGSLVRQCDAMLVNDSGLMHVASAFQIPTVVLFGASNPAVAISVWGKFVPIQHKEIFCVPCLKNKCVRIGDGKLECLKSISTEEAWSALRTLLPAM